jgi:hypothetical protein
MERQFNIQLSESDLITIFHLADIALNIAEHTEKQDTAIEPCMSAFLKRTEELLQKLNEHLKEKEE